MNTIREQLNIYEQEIDQIKEQSRIKVRIKSIIYFLINKDFVSKILKLEILIIISISCSNSWTHFQILIISDVQNATASWLRFY